MTDKIWENVYVFLNHTGKKNIPAREEILGVFRRFLTAYTFFSRLDFLSKCALVLCFRNHSGGDFPLRPWSPDKS